MAKRSPLSKTDRTSQLDDRPSSGNRRWLMWSVFAVTGALVAVGGTYVAQGERNSIARTAMVVSEAATGVQAMANEAALAAQGNPGAVDNLRSWQAKVQTAVTLLQKGGYAAPSDPAPVLALEGRTDIPLNEVQASLAAFDETSRELQESAGSLRDAAQAEALLNESLDGVAKALAAISRQPGLSSGPWGDALQPHKTALSRPEMATMQVVFAPLRGAETLQNQWSQSFTRTATALAELSKSAVADRTMPVAAREQVQALAKSVLDLSQSTTTLAQALPSRLLAKRLQTPLKDRAEAIQKPLGQVGTQVFAWQANRPVSQYVSIAGLLLAFIGLAGLIRAAMRLSQEQQSATQESRHGAHTQESLERLTRNLRRLVRDGNVVPSARLDEDADAPTFTLASIINRLLEARDRLQVELAEPLDALGASLAEGAAPILRGAGASSRQQEQLGSSASLTQTIAQELARLAEDGTFVQAQAQQALQSTGQAGSIMQEGVFRMDAMREQVQTTSKRLKRLAEAAQSIAMVTHVIRDIGRRVKVLSTNAAIEAAAHGEAGRDFAVIANEIQRLAQSSNEAAKDIDQIVNTIQADAQETVAAMEASTAEVVGSTELALRAGNSLRDVEGLNGEMVESLIKNVRDLEKQAVEVARLAAQIDALAEGAKTIQGDAQAAQTAIERARGLHRSVRQELDGQASKL